jgi:hypothetical protein
VHIGKGSFERSGEEALDPLVGGSASDSASRSRDGAGIKTSNKSMREKGRNLSCLVRCSSSRHWDAR